MNSIVPADLADEGGRNQRYGYAWWLIPDYKIKGIYYARGILGQYILCIPEKDMVVVRLGKKREKPSGSETPKDVMYYLDAAIEMYGK